jgi:hypothetical protein
MISLMFFLRADWMGSVIVVVVVVVVVGRLREELGLKVSAERI